MGIAEVLTIIFIVLKLIGNIDWAWWQVFIPMYPALAWYVFILIVAVKVQKRMDREWEEKMDRFRNKVNGWDK